MLGDELDKKRGNPQPFTAEQLADIRRRMQEWKASLGYTDATKAPPIVAEPYPRFLGSHQPLLPPSHPPKLRLVRGGKR